MSVQKLTQPAQTVTHSMNVVNAQEYHLLSQFHITISTAISYTPRPKLDSHFYQRECFSLRQTLGPPFHLSQALCRCQATLFQHCIISIICINEGLPAPKKLASHDLDKSFCRSKPFDSWKLQINITIPPHWLRPYVGLKYCKAKGKGSKA